ncbi:hypothetical protein [Priestia aryabhattai]|uniref:hypothetical protein n=1 Tax=Priestia aryabhattai TaxID=412384 RepID=UPI0032E8CAD6
MERHFHEETKITIIKPAELIEENIKSMTSELIDATYKFADGKEISIYQTAKELKINSNAEYNIEDNKLTFK